jgi:hypothetical protein
MSNRLLWVGVAAVAVVGLAVGSSMAAEPSANSLEMRLRAMEDRVAIEELIAGKYAEALDTNDANGYASIFTEDAYLSVAGKPYRGRKEILQMMEEIKQGHAQYDQRKAPPGKNLWGPVRHIVTNELIRITGNTATSHSYSLEIGSSGRDEKQHGRPQSIMNMCRYEDDLVKQSGQWQISKRLITCDMFGKRSNAPDMFPHTVTPSDVSP